MNSTNPNAMAEAVEELDPMEVEIDIETGEIIGTKQFGHDDLPRIGERINWLRGTIDALCADNHPINLFIDKLEHSREDKIARLQKQIDYFLSAAQPHADNTPDRKIELAGIGRFRYRKGREVVDTSGYDALDEDGKKGFHLHYGHLFTTKTITSPNKKAIKERLNSGGDAPEFSMVQNPDTFEFKGE